MEIRETGRILAKAAIIDNRNIDEMTIAAWHEIIGHLDYRDAITALDTHRRESTEYLQPAHIVAGARKAREAREAQQRRAIATNPQPTHRAKPPAWFREFLNDYGKAPQ